MQTGKAYAASLGTTGLLIASSILLLTLVGAMMAFDGEAGPDSGLPIDGVLVTPPASASGSAETALATSAAATGRREDGAERAARPQRGRSARAPHSSGSPGLGGTPAPAPAPGGGSGAPTPAAPVAGPAPIGAGDTVSTVVGQVAPAPAQDVVQGVTERLP